tara:strand:- start:5742 stop:8240 length:2499 start_codon:yes stop_codon:yes gene_type:complete
MGVSLLFSCVQEPQKLKISIEWELNGNQIEGQNKFASTFHLTNSGTVALDDQNWSLYYSMTPRGLIQDSYTGQVTFNHVSGDLFVIRPDSGFLLAPGEKREMSFHGRDFILKHSDGPAGLYFLMSDGEIYEPNYKLRPFTNPEMITKGSADYYEIPTAESIYHQNKKLKLNNPKVTSRLVPTPLEEAYFDGFVELNPNWSIEASPALVSESNFLFQQLTVIFGESPKRDAKQRIILKINEELIKTGSYQLRIDKDEILIQGADASGVFYGIQSLIGLMPLEVFGNKISQISLPLGGIKDQPRYAYRGMHLDVARNFQSYESLIKLIDLMALYKLNKLHLHLTDDEGWRLESKVLPELTEIGARRAHTINEKEALRPAYGSGPSGGGRGSGFYTQEQYIQMIRYAHERHIEVIPELNMPGHARAAIKAMKARYEKLIALGDEKGALEYYLSDDSDQSVYRSAQFYNDNVVCVCNEAVYHFYETIVDEVLELYKRADVPLKMIHTGGDEVPRGVWEKSPDCLDFLAINDQYDDAKSLQSYFVGRVNKILSDRGLATAGWEEVAMNINEDGSWSPNLDLIGKNVTPFVWNNLSNNIDLGYLLANAGFPIVLCDVSNLYFDMAYNKDPREQGLYWGGFVDTRKVWEFIPENLYRSSKRSSLGKPFNPSSDFKEAIRLNKEGLANILGIQGHLWSESLNGEDQMLEYYYLPRLIGLSERAWAAHPKWAMVEDPLIREEQENTAWNSFVYKLASKELPRLNYFNGGYRYRIPTPGAIRDHGLLKINHIYGMDVRYTTDGSEPIFSSTLYTQPIKVDGDVLIKAFDKTNGSSLSMGLIN